jgi:hypothetical protein
MNPQQTEKYKNMLIYQALSFMLAAAKTKPPKMAALQCG